MYYIWNILGFEIPLREEVVLMRAKLETALNVAAKIAAGIDLAVKFVRGVASLVDGSGKASS